MLVLVTQQVPLLLLLLPSAELAQGAWLIAPVQRQHILSAAAAAIRVCVLLVTFLQCHSI
jgi:hypothetical protein